MTNWNLKALIKITIVCLFLSVITFAETGHLETETHKINRAFTTDNGIQIIVMLANDYKGYNNDYVRVYSGSSETGFKLIDIENVRNYRGPPGMVIYLKNGEVLRLGYPGRVIPSLGSATLTPITLTSELLFELSSLTFPAPKESLVKSCKVFYGL